MRDRIPAPPPPMVTDHALLRYLERIAGLDVEAHRACIAGLVADAVAKVASALVHDGMRYRISDFRVMTVVPAHSDPAQRLSQSVERDEA